MRRSWPNSALRRKSSVPVEVGERDPLVDGEPLDLVEDRRVRRVRRVAPVARGPARRCRPAAPAPPSCGSATATSPSGAPSRRRGRGVASGERAGCPAGKLSAVEVVPRRLDLAAVDDAVAEPEEDVLDLTADLRDQVEPPASSTRPPAASRRRAPRRAGGRARRARARRPARRPRPRSARGPRSGVMPVSRSRTSRSASLSALFRPRYSTRTASISSVVDAAATAASADRSSASTSIGARVSGDGAYDGARERLRRVRPDLRRVLARR